MNPLDTQSLVNDFRLKEKGRDQGSNNRPPTDDPGLHPFETEVVDHCTKFFQNKRDEYIKAEKGTKDRINTLCQSEVSHNDAEMAVGPACQAMNAVATQATHELTDLKKKAQDVIDDLWRFRQEHNLMGRGPDVPENLYWAWGLLALLVLGETIINGIFFADNLSGALVGGLSYAVLISLVNVCGLGLVAATLIREFHHKDQPRRLLGVLGFIAVFVLAVSWNLLVAHYREALSADFPPEPEVATAEMAGFGTGFGQEPVDDTADTGEECWRGDDEADADEEAMCLFLNEKFNLNGFKSVMLMLIGILMWGIATIDWLKMNDPYPGYGKQERRRRQATEELSEARSEVLDAIDRVHTKGKSEQHQLFADPLRVWTKIEEAHRNLVKQHEQMSDFVKYLEVSCRGALEIFRAENRQTRSTKPPEAWLKRWEAEGWTLPNEPETLKQLMERLARSPNRGDWERQSKEAKTAMKMRLEKLGECEEECTERVDRITALSHEL